MGSVSAYVGERGCFRVLRDVPGSPARPSRVGIQSATWTSPLKSLAGKLKRAGALGGAQAGGGGEGGG